jgi:subtilisin family serine protease
LVQFRANATPAKRFDAFRRAGVVPIERIYTPAMQAAGDPPLMRVATPRPVPEAIRLLQQDPMVQVAEPNWIYTHASDDPYYLNGSLWGMYGDATSPANQYGSQAGEAWAAGNTGSNTVYVGIIDTGIQITHPDLAANVWTNPFDPVDGVDNDGNGYVDDINGWEHKYNDNSVYNGLEDTHGTHVAGTIGAVGGTGEGVAGVCWNVTLISSKFLGPAGGSTGDVIKAVDYITDLKTRHGLNIVATNNSWGGGSYSTHMKNCIERARRAGILFVAAAGNSASNNDMSFHNPSGYPNKNIIAVASINSSGALASSSNYGANSVDIGAPGVGVFSTVPENGYASISGTSMAAPHVTGGAALYAATHPGATADAIKNAILNSAVPTPSLSGKCVTGGRLNVSGF